MPFIAGTLIGAVVVIIYTWSGGLWAVTMTDFIQFVAMMITVGLALIIGWRAIGGYERVFEGLVELTGSAEDAGYFFSVGAGYLTPWTLFAYSLTAFAVLCEPAFFQRIFASAGPKEIKKAFTVGVPMWLGFDWAVTFLGILGAAAIGLGIIPEVEANEALMAIVGQYLPIGLLGVFVAGVLAAAMSTADSYFLVAGGVIGYDIYKNMINPKAKSETVERVTKIGMLFSAAISIALAFLFERIMEVWVFQATVIIATALIPVYFATFSKKPVKKIAGLLATAAGLIMSVGWYIWCNFFGTWSEDWAVYVIKLGNLELWQEYGIIIITPIVLIIFLIANAAGRKVAEEMKEVA
jgi:Na+/proline symporter